MRRVCSAICPGTGGELVQGMREDDREYLSSYCIGLYSRAYLVLRESEQEAMCRRLGFVVRSKSTQMKEEIFKLFQFSSQESSRFEVYLETQIPVAKGLAGSTADMGATAGACFSFLEEQIVAEVISRLAAKIEPTDSSFFENTVVFDPLKGEAKEELGFLEDTKSLILVPNTSLDTKDLRSRKEYFDKKRENKSQVSRLFHELRESFSDKNMKNITRIGIQSALLNQNIVETPYLHQLDQIVRDCGGYGLNISHSGTAVCLLLPASMSERELLDCLKKEGLSKYYTSYYSVPVVKGGIQKEDVPWIM